MESLRFQSPDKRGRTSHGYAWLAYTEMAQSEFQSPDKRGRTSHAKTTAIARATSDASFNPLISGAELHMPRPTP